MGKCARRKVLNGMRSMDIVFIGAGRLATQLAQALCAQGHRVTAVYSRTMASARQLAELVGARATDDLYALPHEADAFIIAVKDTALSDLLPHLADGRSQQRFYHTAGSMPLDVFKGTMSHYGVIYPMQTFSKERRVDFARVPLFIEASDDDTLDVARRIAGSVSQRVMVLSSEQRRYLHLAAVFACNFTNHCYALSAEILQRHDIPFDVMLPLIDETAAKVHELQPAQAQTGPAVRYDENVIEAHRQLLADMPDVQSLYTQLSQSIHLHNQK